MPDLLQAQAHATHNRTAIEASSVCGCFYCLHIFPPADIIAWTGLDLSKFGDPDAPNADTALCPRCGSESVIGQASGYPIDLPFLGHMHAAWFEPTIVRKPGARN